MYKVLTWVACMYPSLPGLRMAGGCANISCFRLLSGHRCQCISVWSWSHGSFYICWHIPFAFVGVWKWMYKLLTWVAWLDPSFPGLRMASTSAKISYVGLISANRWQYVNVWSWFIRIFDMCWHVPFALQVYGSIRKIHPFQASGWPVDVPKYHAWF